MAKARDQGEHLDGADILMYKSRARPAFSGSMITDYEEESQ